MSLCLLAGRVAASGTSVVYCCSSTPFFFNTAFPICTVPSGKVPVGGASGRALKIMYKLSGEGLDGNIYLQIGPCVSLSSSPWCTTWKTIHDDRIIQPQEFNYPLVKDLWLPNTKNWNNNLIDSLFTQPTTSAIKSVTVISSDDADILC
jgi:hypothetical protein